MSSHEDNNIMYERYIVVRPIFSKFIDLFNNYYTNEIFFRMWTIYSKYKNCTFVNLLLQTSFGYIPLFFAIMYNKNIIEYIFIKQPKNKIQSSKVFTPLELTVRLNKDPLIIQTFLVLGYI